MGSPSQRRHLIPIGGFLGAGKTTAIRALANHLNDQGLRVGIITNDQGTDLADTRLLRACGFTAEEIPGGCLCCRFEDLVGATRRLSLETDVFIAEAVGSCTDLRATVVAPMRRLEGDRLTVGPLSVVIDPLRAYAELGVDDAPRFSPEVGYIYDRQLEEADLLVINKCDLLDAVAVSRLREVLASRYPRAEILTVSARDDEGLAAWFARLLHESPVRGLSMDVDYDVYGAGEARLGWLDAEVSVTATPPQDADLLLSAMASALRSGLIDAKAEVAHAKMTLESTVASSLGVGAISLVRGSALPDITLAFAGPIGDGRLTINVRAESAPETLERILAQALERTTAAMHGLELTLGRCDAFVPGRPAPTHRDATV
jgi:Ni2+-binding GTPase involved in maturation of urease and hydrogenase